MHFELSRGKSDILIMSEKLNDLKNNKKWRYIGGRSNVHLSTNHIMNQRCLVGP